MKDKKAVKIEVRIAEDEKESLQHLANTSSCTLSDLVRSLLLTRDEKLVVLSEGAEIVSLLAEIRCSLLPNEGLQSESKAISSKLDQIVELLFEVSTKLSDLHKGDDEE